MEENNNYNSLSLVGSSKNLSSDSRTIALLHRLASKSRTAGGGGFKANTSSNYKTQPQRHSFSSQSQPSNNMENATVGGLAAPLSAMAPLPSHRHSYSKEKFPSGAHRTHRGSDQTNSRHVSQSIAESLELVGRQPSAPSGEKTQQLQKQQAAQANKKAPVPLLSAQFSQSHTEVNALVSLPGSGRLHNGPPPQQQQRPSSAHTHASQLQVGKRSRGVSGNEMPSDYRGYLPPAQNQQGNGKDSARAVKEARPNSSGARSDGWSGQLPFVKQGSGGEDQRSSSFLEENLRRGTDKPMTSMSSRRENPDISQSSDGRNKRSGASRAAGRQARRAQQELTHSPIPLNRTAKMILRGSSNDMLGVSSGANDDDSVQNGIMFASISGKTNSLVVLRTPEERAANPERLNLDKRGLKKCPLVENENRLRLLNYQNNNITKISNLGNLPNLIFLDLYNNDIEDLQGELSAVTTLRVLMLGKNKIKQVSGLERLVKLDVLDLHSNSISRIESLDSLAELRVLNLAGNHIRVVHNLGGLQSLTELNLRRNRIEHVFELHFLPALQRVFLSNNQVRSFDHVQCLFKTPTLLELSLDNNPVAADERYRSYLIEHITSLQHLDLKKVTEEERRPASGQSSTRSSGSRLASAEMDSPSNRSHKQNSGATSPSPSHWAKTRSPASRGGDEGHWSKADTADGLGGGSQKGRSRGHGGSLDRLHGSQSQGANEFEDGHKSDVHRMLGRSSGPSQRGSEGSNMSSDFQLSSGSKRDVKSAPSHGHRERSHRDAAATDYASQRRDRYKNLPRNTKETEEGRDSRRRRHRRSGKQNDPNNEEDGTSSQEGGSVKDNAGANPAGKKNATRKELLRARKDKGFYELEEMSPSSNDKALLVQGEAWGWLTKPNLLPLIAVITVCDVGVQRLVNQSPAIVEHCNRLRKLVLINNNLRALGELEKLAVFGSKIVELTVDKNEVTASSFFAPCISYFLPKVEVLNGEPLTLRDRARGRYIFSPKKPPKPRPGSSGSSTKGTARAKKSSSISNVLLEIDFSSSPTFTSKKQEQITRDLLIEKRKGEKAWLRMKHSSMDRCQTKTVFDEQWNLVVEELLQDTIAEAHAMERYMTKSLEDLQKSIVIQIKEK